MSMIALWWLLLALLLAAAVWFDVLYRRIPNPLVLVALAAGLLWAAGAPPGDGLFSSSDPGSVGILATLLSTACVFGVLFVGYLMRFLGAGDVKFIAALSSLYGGWAAAGLVLAIFASGGLLVAARMLDRERRLVVVRNLRLIWLGVIGGAPESTFDPKTESAEHLPFAVAIAAGTVAFSAYVFFDLGAG